MTPDSEGLSLEQKRALALARARRRRSQARPEQAPASEPDPRPDIETSSEPDFSFDAAVRRLPRRTTAITPEEAQADIGVLNARQRTNEEAERPSNAGRERFAGIVNGATLGFGDELAAGAAGIAAIPAYPFTGVSPGEAADRSLQSQRQDLRRNRENRPKEALATELLTGLVTGGGGAKLIHNATREGLEKVGVTRGANLAATATTGGVFGGIVGAGEGEGGTRGDNAQTGALIGTVAGPALQKAAGLAAKAGSPVVNAVRSALPGSGTSTAQLPQVIDGVVSDADVPVRALSNLESLLVRAGVPRARVASGLESVSDSLEGASSGAALPDRLHHVIAREFGQEFPEVTTAIQAQLRGGALRTGSEAQDLTRRAIQQDNQVARNALRESGAENLGAGRRIDAADAAQQQKQELGRVYEEVLARPQSRETNEALTEVLNHPSLDRFKSRLQLIADGQGVDVERLFSERPAEALHWIQSQAGQLSRGQPSAETVAYGQLRGRLLNVLEDALPEYRNLRQSYGDEFTAEEALTFGDKFIRTSKNDFGADQFIRDFQNLPSRAQDNALLSIRDAVLSPANNTREGQAPRVTEIAKEPVLELLARLGQGGAKLADDIETIAGRLQQNSGINPNAGSNTAGNLRADEFAQDTVRGLGGRLNKAVGGGIDDVAARGPLASLIRALSSPSRALGKVSDSRGSKKIDELQRLLLSSPELAEALSRRATQNQTNASVFSGAGGQASGRDR